ncbi:MAG: protein-glutamate O-methyltransferase CheR, partial [Planctomycetes bacterium]|nr:protein-glutamate O-methyltransferase CheR [Planctomycetota bacterium]
YLTLLKSPSHREELEEFFGVVTTNETSFFRTEKHFEWLQSGFLDDLRERVQRKQHDRRIRIWSAACSSGEEPYTIAMCLAENRRKISDWTIEIHGTDISQKALEKARSGVFGSQIAEQIPETLLSQYFKHDQSKNTWIVKPVLSEMVTISQHNLMESFSQHEFDCIFIRNVLIYFSRESKQIVIDNLVRSMATGGYLIIGPSEGIFDMLGMLEKRSPFLYQKVS